MLAEHSADSLPAVDSPQLDLPTHDKAEEQDDGGLFTRERALRLHAAAKFLVEPLNHVRATERLPLRFRKPEEREELIAAFMETGHDARAAFGPRALEAVVGNACGIGAESGSYSSADLARDTSRPTRQDKQLVSRSGDCLGLQTPRNQRKRPVGSRVSDPVQGP